MQNDEKSEQTHHIDRFRDISSIFMDLSMPVDRMNSAFVSNKFYENALLTRQALSYWALASSDSVLITKDSIKKIADLFKKNGNEETLNYLLGKKGTLSF